MSKTVRTSVAAVITLILTGAAATAHAGAWESVRGWLTGEVAALVLSTVLTVSAGASGILFVRIARTFREAGEFFAVLGDAVEDRRITRDELAAVIREGRDIFSLWRPDSP